MRHRYRPGLAYADGAPRDPGRTVRALQTCNRLVGNTGNVLIGEGAMRAFDIARPDSCAAAIVDLFDTFDDPRAFSEMMSERFDGVVLAMANFINPYSDLDDLATVLEHLEVDVFVLGAGIQLPLGETDMVLKPGTRRCLDVLDERARLFGVRGERTLAFLHRLGLSRPIALGCPSMYLYPRSMLKVRAPDDIRRVATAGHLGVRTPRLNRFIETWRGMNRTCELSYVMQDELFLDLKSQLDESRDLYDDATGQLDGAYLNSLLAAHYSVPMPFDRYYLFQDPFAWRQFMSFQDFFIGDRFHGGVAALQAGTPAVIIHNDERVAELTGHFSLPSLSLEAFAEIGPLRAIDLYASEERFEGFRETYRLRYEEYRRATAGAGLSLHSPLPEDVGVGESPLSLSA